MERKPMEWFVENGCELLTPSAAIFAVVYMATQGDPCHECNCKDTCKAWPLVDHPAAKSQPTRKVETNAEMAERLGVSKRQASKTRRV